SVRCLASARRWRTARKCGTNGARSAGVPFDIAVIMLSLSARLHEIGLRTCVTGRYEDVGCAARAVNSLSRRPNGHGHREVARSGVSDRLGRYQHRPPPELERE